MGIKGLKSYITKKGCLVPYELKSTPLIMDGNGLSIILSKCSKSDPRFGGDYDKIYEEIYKFFRKLMRNGVGPIFVILDGRYKAEKETTVKERAKSTFDEVKMYNDQRGSLYFNVTNNHYYIFKTDVFLDVLKDLKIFVCRADSEADEEIIALAGKTGFPVLSNDFDFCICENVTFIPWDDQLLEGDNIKCKRFDREKLLWKENISASVLPLVPVLVDDDYCRMDALKAILHRKISPYSKCKEAFNWLQNKDFSSAKSLIIEAVDQYRFHSKSVIEEKIDFVVQNYTNPKVALDSIFRANPVLNDSLQRITFNIQERDVVRKYGVPGNIAKMVRECRLPSLTLDMLTHREFNARVNSVEYLKEPSVHAPSKRLLQGIYSLLLGTKKEELPITLKIRKNEMIFEDLHEEKLHLLPISNTENLKILYEILEIEESVQEILKFFDNGWFVFILAFIYWNRKCKAKILPAHFHSVLLTAISLNVKKNNFPAGENTISHNFGNLKKDDKKSYTLHKIRKINVDKDFRVPLRDILHVHNYLTFKICLDYTIQIVRLLDLPWEIKISEFISGGYYHSFFTELESKSDCLTFVRDWFDGYKCLQELYRLVMTKLDFI